MIVLCSKRAWADRILFAASTSPYANLSPGLHHRSVVLFLGMIQAAVLSLTCLSTVATAQASPTQSTTAIHYSRVFGAEDADIPLPPQSVPPARKDPGAVVAVQHFISASNVDGISAIQAAGTLIDSNSSKPATLLYTSGNAMRLDVSDEKGQRGFRLERDRATILEASGKKHSLPPATAANGIVVTPFLVSAQITDAQSSFIDQGIVLVGGVKLHRVTVAYSSNQNETVEGSSPPTSIIDLYFDDATHFLSASASYSRLDSRDRAYYLQVISYRGYSSEAGATLAHDYSVSLNGQRQWALHLSNFLSNPSITNGTFHF